MSELLWPLLRTTEPTWAEFCALLRRVDKLEKRVKKLKRKGGSK